MNQPKPKLPYYFHTSKRLKGLDEFEPPVWKGGVKFGERANLSAPTWMNVILISVLVGGAIGWWLAQPNQCASIGSFKIGWC